MEARVAGAVASAELEWLALPGDNPFELEDACRDVMDDGSSDGSGGSGCACAARTAPREVALASFPLLALAAIRRRQSRDA